eukprot:1147912-Pelagomonas_calceolata.AAC.7
MDAVRGLGRALAGKKAGYSEGLLSDSLPELLRRATAKELLIPDVALNQQVAISLALDGLFAGVCNTAREWVPHGALPPSSPCHAFGVS